MIGNVLQFPDLQELCKPGAKPHPRTVEAWCKKNRIRYQYDARGGIWSTLEALNAALGVASNDTPAIKPEDDI